MNRDEIIRMAREAGFGVIVQDDYEWLVEVPCATLLERFAELVAAAEREECAKVCDALSNRYPDEGGDARSCAFDIRARGGE